MTDLATRPAQQGRPFTGAEKGLLFIVSIDEPIATRVLAQLTPGELKELRKATETLTEVDPAAIARIHREFAERVRQGVPASLKGSGAYLRRLAGKALGEGRVAEFWEERPAVEGPMARMAELDVATILGLLENEKPQTLAVILSQFDPGKAAELLSRLPAHQRADVVLRLAKLKKIPESVIREIEQLFEAEMANLNDEARLEIDGIEAAAGIVKRLESDLSDSLLQDISSVDDEVADELRRNLFTFEDLLRVDGRGMQVLLKEISTDQLVVALKSASEDLREKVFGNVSARAANMLRDELEMLGPVKVSDVEQAQQEICAIALKLEQEGRIEIAREGGGNYV